MNRTGDLYMNRIALAVKSALGLAMLVPPGLTLAANATDNSALEEIVVTGIRKSLDVSLEVKRNSTELTEVVTAEDIGKMPDKNVADSLARLPGVTTSAAGTGARCSGARHGSRGNRRHRLSKVGRSLARSEARGD